MQRLITPIALLIALGAGATKLYPMVMAKVPGWRLSRLEAERASLIDAISDDMEALHDAEMRLTRARRAKASYRAIESMRKPIYELREQIAQSKARLVEVEAGIVAMKGASP